MTRSFFLWTLLLASTNLGSAFVNPKAAAKVGTKQTSTELNVGMTFRETEEDARFVLSQAKRCAYGECSVSDAKLMLREILHIQSGCAAGTLTGHDVCEEVDVAADVVAHLRVKAAISEMVGNPLMRRVSVSVATADWSLVLAVLFLSTFFTLQVPHDDIVTHVGWAFQNWDTVLEPKNEIPFLILAAAPYVAISEFMGMAGPAAE